MWGGPTTLDEHVGGVIYSWSVCAQTMSLTKHVFDTNLNSATAPLSPPSTTSTHPHHSCTAVRPSFPGHSAHFIPFTHVPRPLVHPTLMTAPICVPPPTHPPFHPILCGPHLCLGPPLMRLSQRRCWQVCLPLCPAVLAACTGLQFPISCIHHMLKKGKLGTMPSMSVPVPQ